MPKGTALLCPPPGKQLGQQILHLRIHQEGGGEAHVPAGPQLLGKGVRVVEEDEVRLAVPGIGEIPGAQVLGEENGGDSRSSRSWSSRPLRGRPSPL